MFSGTEVKAESFPVINYIWVGPPTGSEGVIGGHDIAGPKHMAELNKSNPIIFWCLAEYKEHYEKIFPDQPNFKVKAIEPYLDYDFEDTALNEAAHKLKLIGQVTLGWGKNPDECTRGTVRDRVSFRNAFLLFLLTFGGYSLDTNVRPASDASKITLPHYPHFKMVNIFGIQIDFWMLYAPENMAATQRALAEYLTNWDRTEEIFKTGDLTKYYNAMEPLVFSALDSIPHKKYWTAKKVNESLYIIDELFIEKRYYNSHKLYNVLAVETQRSLQNNFKIFGNTPIPAEFKSTDGEFGELFTTIQEKNTLRLEELIYYQHDVNLPIDTTGYKNLRPLHAAILFKSYACLEILLKNKANLALKTEFKGQLFTPVELAIRFNRVEAIQMLQKHWKTMRQNQQTSAVVAV